MVPTGTSTSVTPLSLLGYKSSIPATTPRTRHSDLYTLIAVASFALIFIQPLHWRQYVWQSYVLDPVNAYTGNDYAATKLYIVLFGSVLLHTLVFWTCNAFFGVLYYLQQSYFEQFKIQQHKKWPWQTAERGAYFTLLKKAVVQICINDYIVSPLLVLSSWKTSSQRISIDIADMPHWYTSLWQVMAFMIIEDTIFYFAHRLLHHPKIYPHIHKQHHSFYQPIGIAAEYAHPLEFIFSNAIPFSVGPQLLSAHCFTFFLWLTWRMIETVDGHSGYELPFTPLRLVPFSGSATAHDFHHSRNVGNYASFFTWWDRICGTDRYYPEYITKVEASYRQPDSSKLASAIATTEGNAVKQLVDSDEDK